MLDFWISFLVGNPVTYLFQPLVVLLIQEVGQYKNPTLLAILRILMRCSNFSKKFHTRSKLIFNIQTNIDKKQIQDTNQIITLTNSAPSRHRRILNSKSFRFCHALQALSNARD